MSALSDEQYLDIASKNGIALAAMLRDNVLARDFRQQLLNICRAVADAVTATPSTPVVPEAILEIGRRMIADAKDNDHCTAHPLFVVKRRRVVTGIDTDYTDNIAWIEDGEILDADESAPLEAAYQETGEVPDGYTRTGYCEEWEHVDTYLTEQAAMARIDRVSEGRVSVESAYRNKEMQEIRKFIMSLASEK